METNQTYGNAWVEGTGCIVSPAMQERDPSKHIFEVKRMEFNYSISSSQKNNNRRKDILLRYSASNRWGKISRFQSKQTYQDVLWTISHPLPTNCLYVRYKSEKRLREMKLEILNEEAKHRASLP